MGKLSDFFTRLFGRQSATIVCNDRCVNGVFWRFEMRNGRCVPVEAMRPCRPGDEGYTEDDGNVAAVTPPVKPHSDESTPSVA